MGDFFRIFFVFVYMGPYGSENLKTLLQLATPQPNVFKLLLNFLPNGPHTTTFGIFEIMKIEILTLFFLLSLTRDPMGEKISKLYSSYKLQPNVFKLEISNLNFPANGPHKSTFGNFEFCVSDINDFFSKISNSPL